MRMTAVLLVVAVAVMAGVEANSSEGGGFFRRFFRRMFADRGTGEGQDGQSGILDMILQFLGFGDDAGSTGTLSRMTLGTGKARGIKTFFGIIANYGFAFACDTRECEKCVLNVPGVNITQSPDFKVCVRTIIQCTENCFETLKTCATSISEIANCYNTIP